MHLPGEDDLGLHDELAQPGQPRRAGMGNVNLCACALSYEIGLQIQDLVPDRRFVNGFWRCWVSYERSRLGKLWRRRRWFFKRVVCFGIEWITNGSNKIDISATLEI